MQNDIKILLADDDDICQALFKKTLEKLEYFPVTCNNGEEVVEIFKKDQYNLIFLDMRMPLMDGPAAAKRIREDEVNKGSIKIIGLSGNTSDKDIKECFASGMDDYLVKPITKSKIIEIIKKHFPNGGLT